MTKPKETEVSPRELKDWNSVNATITIRKLNQKISELEAEIARMKQSAPK